MTHDDLITELLNAGFETGWVVQGEKIVMWLNDEPVPVKLAEFVELASE
jgi:hypothetical protein